MEPDFKVTLDIAQLVLLGGLIWGLAKMSAAVDSLRLATGDLAKGLEKVDESLNDIIGRVRVLEDRRRHS